MSASSKKKLRKEQAASALTEKQQKERAEAKKLKAISVTFVVIMLVVALTAASILAVRAVNNSGIIDRNTIAAVAGEHKLNSVQLNYYFTDYVKNYYNQFQSMYGSSASSYLSVMGLSVNKPLDTQVQDAKTGKTWADFFLEGALVSVKSDYALYNKAVAEGYKLPEDEQKALDQLVQQLDLYAALSGYKNADKYLQASYGYGADAESYVEYSKISAIASSYYAAHSESLTYNDEAIREREKVNPDKYASFSYAGYYLASSTFLEGGTKTESGTTTYSEEEKAAALKKAEETANILATSKDLVELDKAIAALDINKENENAATTKYDDVLYSSLPAAVKDWLVSKDRKDGDIAVLPNETTTTDADNNETKTVNGYYVVVFQSRNENLRHLANVRHLLVEFEGGTTGSNGNKTYSAAEKAKAKTEAERLLQVWKDGAATEESFIALVKEYSDDTSAADGGLFEDIHKGSNYVPTFKGWALDPDRKPGDTDVIVSDYGYHVMFYVGDGDLTYRDYMITEELRAEDMEKWYEEVLKTITVTTEKTNRLNLDMIISFS